MTAQEKISKGKKMSAQEIAKRSRAALRTSTVNVGTLAIPPIIVGQLVDNLIPKAVLDSGNMVVRFDTDTINVPTTLTNMTFINEKPPREHRC